MTDYASRPIARLRERGLVILAYVLFLIASTAFPAGIAGVILAHVRIREAGPFWASHYRFQIQTFWLAVLGAVLFSGLMMMGSVGSAVLGGLLMTAVGLWALARTIIGLLKAVQGDPISNPGTLSLGL